MSFGRPEQKLLAATLEATTDRQSYIVLQPCTVLPSLTSFNYSFGEKSSVSAPCTSVILAWHM
jgi:hypothetical protein